VGWRLGKRGVGFSGGWGADFVPGGIFSRRLVFWEGKWIELGAGSNRR